MRCLSIFKKLLFELREGLIGVRRIYLFGILLMVVFETVNAGNPSSLVQSRKDYNPFASLLKDHSLATDPLINTNSPNLHQSEGEKRESLELQSHLRIDFESERHPSDFIRSLCIGSN